MRSLKVWGVHWQRIYQEWWCGLQRVESGLGPLRPILKGIEIDLSGFKRQMQMGLTD